MSKKGGRGRGVISNPKNVIANLRIFTSFRDKSAMKFPKIGRGEGGSKVVWTFSKKNPNLGTRSSLTVQSNLFGRFDIFKRFSLGKLVNLNIFGFI